MRTSSKKIFKYLFVLLLLVAVGYGGYMLLFPAPSATLAYENLSQIQSDQRYVELMKTNSQLHYLLATENSSSVYTPKYEHVAALYGYLDDISDFACKTLVYATNNKTYNKKTNAIKTSIKKLDSLFDEIKSYTDSYYTPFYNNSQKTKGSIQNYATVFYDFNKQVLDLYFDILQNATQILPSLEQSYVNSEYIQTKNSTSLALIDTLIAQFGDTSAEFNASTLSCLESFVARYNLTNCTSFYDDSEKLELLDTIKDCDFTLFAQNVFTENETEFFNSLSQQQQQIFTNFVTFIYGY